MATPDNYQSMESICGFFVNCMYTEQMLWQDFLDQRALWRLRFINANVQDLYRRYIEKNRKR